MWKDWSTCFTRTSMCYYFSPHPLEHWNSYFSMAVECFAWLRCFAYGMDSQTGLRNQFIVLPQRTDLFPYKPFIKCLTFHFFSFNLLLAFLASTIYQQCYVLLDSQVNECLFSSVQWKLQLFEDHATNSLQYGALLLFEVAVALHHKMVHVFSHITWQD